MRTLIKLVLFVLAVCALFLGVCLVRAFMYTSSSAQADYVTLPDTPEISAESAAAKLSRAIQFQTITLTKGDPRAGQDAAWSDLRAYLQSAFPDLAAQSSFETVAGNSLIITWGGDSPAEAPVILMGHMDVVPVDFTTINDWEHPPFSGAISDGFVYGRGTMDCKGPIVAMLEAAELLASSGWVPERSIIFQYGHDEEVGARDGAHGFACGRQIRR